ncbi:hypothetical protein NDU88_006324 [Pleurodeles waltl]|uniref:Uncharacterized protein n=1 Tax=Pleurodeles waltl TaxID=8319 RepID=A0AAV7L704_PLEWA|nr:hypothetical protein NDU88_006324 [Pleurodeles waltl]
MGCARRVHASLEPGGAHKTPSSWAPVACKRPSIGTARLPAKSRLLGAESDARVTVQHRLHTAPSASCADRPRRHLRQPPCPNVHGGFSARGDAIARDESESGAQTDLEREE